MTLKDGHINIGEFCHGSAFGHTWHGRVVGHVYQNCDDVLTHYAIRYHIEEGDDQPDRPFCVRALDEVQPGVDEDYEQDKLIEAYPDE